MDGVVALIDAFQFELEMYEYNPRSTKEDGNMLDESCSRNGSWCKEEVEEFSRVVCILVCSR